MNAISFYGFGGAYAVALQNVGITLDQIVEPGGFGLPAVLHNAERLRFTGPSYTSKDEEAPAHEVDVVLGNPPCSGFSLLNTAKTGNARHVDSDINHCMKEFVAYAARCSPQVAIFESVQGAGKMGAPLMQWLIDYLNRHSPYHYELTHVFMSGATIGAAQIRKRYFWVAHRVPFGIEPPVVEHVVTYEDAIGDLIDAPIQKELQPYPPVDHISPYAQSLRADGVTDHIIGSTNWDVRIMDIAKYIKPGETHRHGISRARDADDIPESWAGRDIDYVINGNYFSGAVRIRPDGAGHVVTGSGGMPFIHWWNDRPLTVRETSRLMGFPDWFSWSPFSISRASAYLGKQVPVQSWTWILGWVKNAIEGHPGSWAGDRIDDHWVIDITHDYKQVYNTKTRQQPVDMRSKAQKEIMAARTLVPTT